MNKGSKECCMSTWEWTESYEVNNNKLDSHHKKIMNLFNNLYTDICESTDVTQKKPLVEKALEELIEYSLYHFNAEEELMLKYEYPGYLLHKEEHEQFKVRVKQLMEQHQESIFGMAFPVLYFIKEWLIFHIINVDKQYANYLTED